MKLISSSDVDYKVAVSEFIKWGDDFTNNFYSGAPEGTFTPEEISDNEIYGYQTEPLVPHLYRLWRLDDKAEFQQLLSAFSREALLIYLNEQEYHGAERALTAMVKKLWEDAHNESDSDFWMIVYLHSIEVDQFIPAEVRTVIHRLSAVCGTTQMKQWELKVITWWGDKSEGGIIIPKLFELAELISDGNYDNLGSDDIYLPLKVNQSSKSIGTRPIPYYSKYFLASLRNQVYPISFLDALWLKVVRSPLINHSRKLTDVDYQLLEYFLEKLDDNDPVFVKGWLLLDNEKYSESIPLFLSVIKSSPNWYGAYRNVSCAAECLGNIQMAYEYEKMAHDNGLDIPDRHSGQLQRIVDLLSDQQNIETQLPLNVEWLYTQHESHTMNPEQLDLESILSAIAYVEHFSIPGTDQYRPILSQRINWMPGKNKGAGLARNMLLDKTAYLLGSQQGLGISEGRGGEIDFDFKLVSFILNLKNNDNVPLLLPQLYDVLEQQLQNSTSELIQSSIRPILVKDLVDFAIERFEAYDIPVNYDHGFETTAEHCLEKYPLTVCYGLFYHEIEDAAGAQREKGMSYRHTVNYGLKCVRSKADRAFDERWDLQSYDRSKSASEPSAIISLMHSISKFNL